MKCDSVKITKWNEFSSNEVKPHFQTQKLLICCMVLAFGFVTVTATCKHMYV